MRKIEKDKKAADENLSELALHRDAVFHGKDGEVFPYLFAR